MKHVSAFVPPFVRSAFNYDRDAASQESGLLCEDPSRTQQSFAEECDINTICRRFGVTGMLPQNVAPVLDSAFHEIFDYQSALNVMRQADESFMTMPAHVRARFHNDAGEFVDFVSDEDNRYEAIKLGLVMPPPVDAPPAQPQPPEVSGAPIKGAPPTA